MSGAEKGAASEAAPHWQWCYDIALAPTDDTRILALWHFGAPDRDVVRIVWRANAPTSGMIYLTAEGGEAPHYMPTPHAFTLFPEIKRPRR